MEIRKVRKQGDSLAICMPKAYLEFLKLKRDSFVEIELKQKEIVIRKLRSHLEVK